MTPRTTFRDLVEDGRVHVLDGAMGTLLYFSNLALGSASRTLGRILP